MDLHIPPELEARLNQIAAETEIRTAVIRRGVSTLKLNLRDVLP